GTAGVEDAAAEEGGLVAGGERAGVRIVGRLGACRRQRQHAGQENRSHVTCPCRIRRTRRVSPMTQAPASRRLQPRRGPSMQYMILIYEPEGCYDGPAGEAALQDIVAKHMALAGELRAAGIQKEGAGLQGIETATTVVTSDGGRQTVHDGPFAETREHLGGYYVIDVPN